MSDNLEQLDLQPGRCTVCGSTVIMAPRGAAGRQQDPEAVAKVTQVQDGTVASNGHPSPADYLLAERFDNYMRAQSANDFGALGRAWGELGAALGLWRAANNPSQTPWLGSDGEAGLWVATVEFHEPSSYPVWHRTPDAAGFTAVIIEFVEGRDYYWDINGPGMADGEVEGDRTESPEEARRLIDEWFAAKEHGLTA